MQITGLVLWVRDNTLSQKFYKKLGFAVVRSDDEVTEVRLGGFMVTLVSLRQADEFAGDTMMAKKGKGMYMYVHVPSVDKEYQRLVAAKLHPVTSPRDWPWGNREFVIKDPDGYKLCFWQPVEPKLY